MKFVLKIAFIFLFVINTFAQNDCSDAIVVCGSSGYTDLEATGVGIQELTGLNTCSSAENNSIWLKLNINNGGTLGFTLKPNSNEISEDFDFFIFGPNVNCGNIGQAIRCSTTNPLASGQVNNFTGMNNFETDTAEGPGAMGNSYVQWLTVNSGDSYFLVIDRPIGTSNFSIDWNGTATFFEEPTFDIPSGNSLNIEQCDTDGSLDNLSVFNLSVNNGAIGTQSNITSAYYTSNNNAILKTNPITDPTNYQNTSSPQTIYQRLTNTITACFSIIDFTLTSNSGVAYNPAQNLISCDYDNDGFSTFDLTLNNSINIDSATNTLTFFGAENDALLNNTSKILPNNYTNAIANTNEIVWARVENSTTGCYSIISFELEITSFPTINLNYTVKQCDEDGTPDGITDFNLNEANDYLTLNDATLNVSYFLTFNNADTNTSAINPSPFSNGTASTVYARIENTNGCHRVAQVDLLVSSTSFPSGYIKTITSCDDDDILDGLRLFNLADNNAEIINLFPTGQNLTVYYFKTLDDALLEQNAIDTSSSYLSEAPYNQTLYVRVESEDNGECYGLGPYLELIVEARPEFDLDDTAIYCTNLNPITVSINSANGTYTYIWTNENDTEISDQPYAIIAEEGTYTVIATSAAGCVSFPHTILIEPSNIAAISQDDITIADDSNNNTITISTTNLGIGAYEFALDSNNGLFQDEPYFENVTAGIHTVFVRDKNYCGTTSTDVSIIGYPNFFTPNNDGINDTWQVLGVNETFYSASNIYIFNRFGKLITQIDPNGDGWNGFFNGETLPASDYWFSVELINQDGSVNVRKGHFSLIR